MLEPCSGSLHGTPITQPQSSTLGNRPEVEAATATRERRLIDLLSDLTEDDVVRLCSFQIPFSHNAAWREKHRQILMASGPYFDRDAAGEPGWTAEAYEVEAQSDLQIRKLIARGLLREEWKVRPQGTQAAIGSASFFWRGKQYGNLRGARQSRPPGLRGLTAPLNARRR